MRIVNFEEFLALGPGVVFSPLGPQGDLYGIFRKGAPGSETWSFFEKPLLPAKAEDPLPVYATDYTENKITHPTRKFAIFEKPDLEALSRSITSNPDVVHGFLEVLNSAYKADPAAIHSLFVNRVPCNEGLVSHPEVIVRKTMITTPPFYSVDAFGLLSGVLFKLTGMHIRPLWTQDPVPGEDYHRFEGFTAAEPQTPNECPSLPGGPQRETILRLMANALTSASQKELLSRISNVRLFPTQDSDTCTKILFDIGDITFQADLNDNLLAGDHVRTPDSVDGWTPGDPEVDNWMALGCIIGKRYREWSVSRETVTIDISMCYRNGKPIEPEFSGTYRKHMLTEIAEEVHRGRRRGSRVDWILSSNPEVVTTWTLTSNRAAAHEPSQAAVQ